MKNLLKNLIAPGAVAIAFTLGTLLFSPLTTKATEPCIEWDAGVYCPISEGLCCFEGPGDMDCTREICA